jgi:hypothetical protein
MAVPSSAAHFVRISVSPGRAPPEVTSRSRGARPTAVIETIGAVTPGATSV